MTARIDNGKIEIIRQQFLAGESLRKLAKKHKTGLRTLADYAKRGGWAVARDTQRTATALPVLARAADNRAAAINQSWTDRIGGLIENLGAVASRAGAILAGQNLDNENYRDLASLLRILIEGISKLRDLMPDQGKPALRLGGIRPDEVRLLTTDQLQAMLAEVERLIVQLGGPGALDALDVDAEPSALMLDSEDVSAGAAGDQPAEGRETDDLESKIS